MSEELEQPVKKTRKPRVVKPKETVEKVVKQKKAKPETIVEISAQQVSDYLKSHPDFFIENVHLLEHLSIPHPSGVAVSLISKQLELFRSRSQEMENQLLELIEIARGNDTAMNRMHQLNLALHDAQTIEEVVTNLHIVLTEYFLTDFVAIRLIQTDSSANLDNVFIAPDSKDLKPFDNEFRTGRPTCGKLTLTQARVLFGFQANEVKSCAIIPMLFTDLEGLLAIGSRDENRFHASMGHLFLTQMSEVIATRLITLLQQEK
ncbi:MAG: DUF484 family protein [Methylococcales bacterium]|nr:DUF484 family protein [Methylococcales bacterium]